MAAGDGRTAGQGAVISTKSNKPVLEIRGGTIKVTIWKIEGEKPCPSWPAMTRWMSEMSGPHELDFCLSWRSFL